MAIRRSALTLVALAAILAGAAGFYFRQPPVPPDSIALTPAYQDNALLSRSWALRVAHLYGPDGYLFQQNPSVCGPTSIADVMRSEGRAADPSAILNASGVFQVFGFLPNGLTLDQEAEILKRNIGAPVRELRNLSLDEFRAEMAKSNDPAHGIVVNFTRVPLFGRGGGHFSPVLGYLSDRDLVFVGDVNANYRPWLVPTQRLYDAQNTVDSVSHAKRGVLEVEASNAR